MRGIHICGEHDDYIRFYVFGVVCFHIVVFRVTTLYTLVGGYQLLEEHGALKMDASAEILAFMYRVC